MRKLLRVGLVIGFSLFIINSWQKAYARYPVVGEKADNEIISLLGKRLIVPETDLKTKEDYEKARDAFLKNPTEESIIWYGRRAAYLYKYKEAIKIYTEGVRLYPASYRLYRHRGHRYISIRLFDHAVSDLEKAALLVKGRPLEVEPDGIPNKLNIPLSNTQFNIWYHLGLAYYLKGNYAKAVSAYSVCLKWSNNDDLLVATLDWLYMNYRRLGKKVEAAKLLKKVHEKMDIIENRAYHSRLLMYKGLMSPEKLLQPVKSKEDDERLNLITQGYGAGNWYFYHGQKTKAREIFESVVKEQLWSAFGYIAAEVDLARHFSKK